MTEPTLTLKLAAIYYTALEIAIGNVEDTLERDTNTARPYRSAMKLQLEAYQAEYARLGQAFPALVQAAKS